MTDLMELEKLVHSALSRIRSAKMRLMMESVENLKKKEHILRNENELLEKQIEAQKKADDVNNVVTRFIDYDQTDRVTHNLLPGL